MDTQTSNIKIPFVKMQLYNTRTHTCTLKNYMAIRKSFAGKIFDVRGRSQIPLNEYLRSEMMQAMLNGCIH